MQKTANQIKISFVYAEGGLYILSFRIWEFGFHKNLEWIWQALYSVIDKKIIFAENKEVDMATYTITVNERTREGKSLVNYLKSLGVIDVPNDETLQAMKDIEDGNVTVYKTFEDYLEAYK